MKSIQQMTAEEYKAYLIETPQREAEINATHSAKANRGFRDEKPLEASPIGRGPTNEERIHYQREWDRFVADFPQLVLSDSNRIKIANHLSSHMTGPNTRGALPSYANLVAAFNSLFGSLALKLGNKIFATNQDFNHATSAEIDALVKPTQGSGDISRVSASDFLKQHPEIDYAVAEREDAAAAMVEKAVAEFRRTTPDYDERMREPMLEYLRENGLAITYGALKEAWRYFKTEFANRNDNLLASEHDPVTAGSTTVKINPLIIGNDGYGGISSAEWLNRLQRMSATEMQIWRGTREGRKVLALLDAGKL